jgi:hypothetical protein
MLDIIVNSYTHAHTKNYGRGDDKIFDKLREHHKNFEITAFT